MGELVATLPRVQFDRPKVLLVDDNPNNLVALDRTLRDLDVEMVKATSGSEALKCLLRDHFALALLDVQMPDMDGYELAEIIRNDRDTQDLPIIFISAHYTDKLNIFKGYEQGAFSFITKPFDPKELLKKVQFFIDKYNTEKAYQASQERLLELYNNSPDMLISVDIPSFGIRHCNRTLLAKTGYTLEELKNKRVFDICHPDAREKAEGAFQRFATLGGVENEELSLKARDGKRVEVLLNATAIRDHHGQITLANTSWRDVTELNMTRRKLEDALSELEIHNRELQEFIYLTSHDLQEPTLTVINYVELLEKELEQLLNSESRQYLKFARSASLRMRELVMALLNYLNLGQDIHPEQVDCNGLLNEVVGEMDTVIKETGAAIEIGELPVLEAGRSMMKMLFRHLIGNAIKYTRETEKPSIRIWVEKEDEYWRFNVRDNGIGIREDQQEKIFMIFQQLHNRGEYPGLGIGLAMAKKIVELHHGSIGVKSKPGKGSTFFFRLHA